MSASWVDPRTLRLTAYPPGPDPFTRWELTVEASGKVLATGTSFPCDDQPARDLIRAAADAYLAGLEAASKPD